MIDKKRNQPKSHRIQIVLDVLERYGRSDKDLIFMRVANQLDDDPHSESFQRAIYRDLFDLELRGAIKVDYFHRDGSPILEFDESIHKNYFKQWYIPTAEGKINGSGNLEKVAGLIYVPPIIRNEFAIVTGQTGPGPKYRHIYFQVGHQFMCLKTSLDAIEYSLAISRTHGEINSKEIDEIKKIFGNRVGILKLPFPKLSSYKPEVQPCHAKIKFLSDSKIEIEDFGSTNGVFVYKLTTDEADEMRYQGEKINSETVTVSWVINSNIKTKPEKVNKILKIDCPVLIEFGESNHILIV